MLREEVSPYGVWKGEKNHWTSSIFTDNNWKEDEGFSQNSSGKSVYKRLRTKFLVRESSGFCRANRFAISETVGHNLKRRGQVRTTGRVNTYRKIGSAVDPLKWVRRKGQYRV